MPHRLPDRLDERLAEIDRLPLSFEGRLLARLAARINAREEVPAWVGSDECARIGEAVIAACHEARVPVSAVRRLVDPGAAAWERGAFGVMRPRD